MNIFRLKNRWIISLLFLLFAVQGCIAKKETVTFLPEIEEPIACSEMLSMDVGSIPSDDFGRALNRSHSGAEFDRCWKPLMERALKAGRHIPIKHLARAVHVFNRNDSQDQFSLAVYMYFKEIIKGNGVYKEVDKKLLEGYLRFIINNAKSKQDEKLKKARLICSRLDSELYGKFFR